MDRTVVPDTASVIVYVVPPRPSTGPAISVGAWFWSPVSVPAVVPVLPVVTPPPVIESRNWSPERSGRTGRSSAA